MQMREELIKYHKEYLEETEALHDAEMAIEDLAKRTGQQTLSGAERGDNLSGRYQTIGESLIRRFVENGGINLVGEKVSEPAELACLMQAYRNPLFETLRIIYIKDEHILAAEGYSNQLPGLVTFPGTVENLAKHINKQMERISADGYYLTHNHPSGNPKPSASDRMTTLQIARATENFKGHIVTNHSRYALIDGHFDYTIEHMENDTEDILAEANAEYPIVGRRTDNPEIVAEIARELQIPEQSKVSLVIYSASDGRIRMLHEVSNEVFKDQSFKPWLRDEMKSIGATNSYCVTSDADLYEASDDLIVEGYMQDMLFVDPDYPFYWSKNEAGLKADSEKYVFAGLEKKDITTNIELQGFSEEPVKITVQPKNPMQK